MAKKVSYKEHEQTTLYPLLPGGPVGSDEGYEPGRFAAGDRTFRVQVGPDTNTFADPTGKPLDAFNVAQGGESIDMADASTGRQTSAGGKRGDGESVPHYSDDSHIGRR